MVRLDEEQAPQLGPTVAADHPAPSHDAEHDYDADQVVGLDVEQIGKAQPGRTDTADHTAHQHIADQEARLAEEQPGKATLGQLAAVCQPAHEHVAG